jgi:hypothetical protein
MPTTTQGAAAAEVINNPQSLSKCSPGAHQARRKNKREQRENDECPQH